MTHPRNPLPTVTCRKPKRRRFGNKNTGTAVMSQKEIGELWGITQQTVQGIEQRALKKIKAAIESAAEREHKTVRQWLFTEE